MTAGRIVIVLGVSGLQKSLGQCVGMTPTYVCLNLTVQTYNIIQLTNSLKLDESNLYLGPATVKHHGQVRVLEVEPSPFGL